MTRNLDLSIPKPCTEKWGNFLQVSGGGFCSSCHKTVIDFTRMTDDEIVHYFKNNHVHTCGRFRREQIRSYALHAPVINPGFTLLKAGFLSLLFALVSKQTFAQTTAPKVKTELNVDEQQTHADNSWSQQRFAGIVTDALDKSALPGVNVVLKGTQQGTVTDLNGRFEFPIPLKEGDVLVFTFIGLRTKEFTVTRNALERIEMTMELCMDYELMGEVAIGGLYISNRSGLHGLWTKVKSWF